MDKMKILLMFVSELDIPSSEGRDAIQGTSIEYFFFGNDGELVKPRLCVDGTVGMRRGKSFLSPDMINNVSYVPGIYDGQFEMQVDSKGKPSLKLVDLEFIGKANISLVPEKEVK